MKTKFIKRIAKKNDGFTMVELMVVVAILGVLATIAVPQYNRFMAKARQAEAKIALSGIYTAEQSFFVENQTYTGFLTSAGYKPEGDKTYYSSGFRSGLGAICGPSASYNCYGNYYRQNAAPSQVLSGTNFLNNAFFPASTRAGTGIATVTNHDDLPDSADNMALSNNAFVAAAGGQILSGASPLDQWTINQDKLIKQVGNGIP